MSKICSIICGAPDGSLPEKPEGLIICADKVEKFLKKFRE